MALPAVAAPCDPFHELASRCGSEADEFLVRLEIIRRNAGELWSVPRMPWYTQHGTSHSDSLVRLVGETISHLQTTPQYLDCSELYVLLAACYLHDVGMQYVDIGKPLDQLEPTDHDEIRRVHPTIARELIVERTKARLRDDFDPGVADDDFLAPIALVSEAHGTATYADAVAALVQTRPQPRGAPFRGDLLGAVLLMVDELDIQRSRATFPKEAELSTVSMMHHLMNHYVSAVRVGDGDTPKERRIRIDVLSPAHQQRFIGDVLEWILGKMMRQARLTNPVVATRTQGEMRWDARIEVYEAVDAVNALRSPDAATRRFVRREVLERRLVGRRDALQTLRRCLTEAAARTNVIVDLIMVDDGAEEVALIFQWLAALAIDLDLRPVHLAPSIIRAGHGQTGVVQHVGEQAGVGAVTSTEALIDALADSDRQLLLLIEGVPEGGDARRAIEAFSRGLPGVVILAGDQPSGLAAETVELFPLAEDAICAHLVQALGFDGEEARDRARALYAATSGRASHVILALYTEFTTSVVKADD